MTARTARTTFAASVLSALVLTGCTSVKWSDDPPLETLPAASAFRAGACSTAADTTLSLAKLAHRNRKAKKLPDEDRKDLTSRQNGLVELKPMAETDLRDPLEQLIVSIGYVRLTSDGNKYRPVLLTDMDKARRRVQKVCVPA